MAMFPFVALLLNSAIVGAAAATITGDVQRLALVEVAQPIDDASFKVLATLTISGGTSPTAAAFVELSADGTHWYRVALSGITLDAAGTVAGVIDVFGMHFMRAVLVTTGGPTLTARLELLGNHVFSLTDVS